MKTFLMILKHYAIGIAIAAVNTSIVVLYDFVFKGYLLYPTLKNGAFAFLISGIFLGAAHYCLEKALLPKSMQNAYKCKLCENWHLTSRK